MKHTQGKGVANSNEIQKYASYLPYEILEQTGSTHILLGGYLNHRRTQWSWNDQTHLSPDNLFTVTQILGAMDVGQVNYLNHAL